MSKILMVLSHADDEVIFGYPILQYHPLNEVYLLTLTNNNKYGKGPQNALKEICALNNIHLIDLPRLQPNFYRLPTRYEEVVLPNILKICSNNIKRALDISKPDYIFTHNPMGEYGHGDHRTTFNLVSQFNTPLMFTDICITNPCHLSSEHIPSIYKTYLYDKAKAKEKVTLKMEWYIKMKCVYEKHEAWSWSGHPPVKDCALYSF